MLDQLLLIHEAAVLLPVLCRRQIAEEFLLNDFLAFVNGTAEHSLARAALTDCHAHVGSQALAAKGMPAVTQYLATEGAAGGPG